MFTASQQEWADALVGQSATVFPNSRGGELRHVYDIGNGRAVVLAVADDGPMLWMQSAPAPTPEEQDAGGALESTSDPAQRAGLIAVERARVDGELAALLAELHAIVAPLYGYGEPVEVEGAPNDPATVEPPITDPA